MTYEIRYSKTGHPYIVKDGTFRLSAHDELAKDFTDFLTWNAQQTYPLDWQTIVPPPLPTTAELATNARRAGAKEIAASVTGWFNWTPAQANDWIQTNIGTPLTNGRTNPPTTLRAVFLAVLDILDKMLVIQIAMAKMIIALRDDRWPEQ
jgi:hypothetical protein